MNLLRAVAWVAAVFWPLMPTLAGAVPRLAAADTSACGGPGAMKPARDFLLRDADNRKWRLSATRGKVVLIDFWATWCGPCKVEIPGFVELYARYRDQGFEVVGVSMDTDLGAIKSFAVEHKMNYPILIGAGADGIIRAWEVVGLPTTVLVSRDGRVCRRFVGQTPKEQFEELIRNLL